MNEGASFPDFITKGGLPKNNDNEIHSIIEDRMGKLWFGTRGKAYIYDGITFTVFTNNGKPFTNVRSIIEDKKGNIWLGGNDGLWRYDPARQSDSAALRAGGGTFTNFAQNSVSKIYEDKNGNIWTSSQRANDARWLLSRYEANSLSDQKPRVTEIESEYEQNKGMILGILEANDGSIWFGGGDGVRRFDPSAMLKTGGNIITHFKSKED